MKTRSLEEIRSVVLSKNYAFFEKGDFNLNIIATREDDVFDNGFTDTLDVIYKEKGIWRQKTLPWTTLAGAYGHGGEQSPLTRWETGTEHDGVAVIMENQYRGAFKLVLNGNRYPFKQYFHQVKGLDYYRDNDKNGVISRKTAPIVRGQHFSTHIHPMSQEGTKGDKVSYPGWGNPWSQGCNGNGYLEFQKLLNPAIESLKYFANSFTYTLLHAEDFK